MGVGGISIWQLLIILLIVILLFGTKRLKTIGADLGNAVKGFRSAMTDQDKNADDGEAAQQIEGGKPEAPAASGGPQAAQRSADARPADQGKA